MLADKPADAPARTGTSHTAKSQAMRAVDDATRRAEKMVSEFGEA